MHVFLFFDSCSRTDGPTNGQSSNAKTARDSKIWWTYQPTDMARCRVACPRLKKNKFNSIESALKISKKRPGNDFIFASCMVLHYTTKLQYTTKLPKKTHLFDFSLWILLKHSHCAFKTIDTILSEKSYSRGFLVACYRTLHLILSVGRSVPFLLFWRFWAFWAYGSCPNALVTSSTAPAYPHATRVAVYLEFGDILLIITMSFPEYFFSNL